MLNEGQKKILELVEKMLSDGKSFSITELDTSGIRFSNADGETVLKGDTIFKSERGNCIQLIQLPSGEYRCIRWSNDKETE